MCGITIYKDMYRWDYHKIIIWKFEGGGSKEW